MNKYEYFIVPRLQTTLKEEEEDGSLGSIHKLREHIVTASIAYRF